MVTPDHIGELALIEVSRLQLQVLLGKELAMDAITLNGRAFVPIGAPLGNAIGHYKALAKSIKLFNGDGDHIGTINKYGCLCAATRLDDGRTWYNFATIKEIGRYESYLQSVDEPGAALRQCGIERVWS